MRRPVLLIIDMLNDYAPSFEPKRLDSLTTSINTLATTFRRHSHPIFWVRQEFAPDLSDAFPEMRTKNIHVCIRGTHGAQIMPQLTVYPSDRVLIKTRYSAFFNTPLDQELARLQPDTLILTGINTHACIRTTAIDAYQRDLPVVLATDCISSYDREHHDISLRYMIDKIATAMTNPELEAALLENTPVD
jgi:nicotinamidase-related amidase